MTSLQEKMARDGYVVVPALLKQEEIGRLREALDRHFERQWLTEGTGKHQPGAETAIPDIGWIFSHQEVLQVFSELGRGETPVFTGNCDAHKNMLSWWHKDTSEGKGGCFPNSYFENTEAQVFRAGIYMQDHTNNRHGLKIRKGSHLTRSISTGDVEYVPTQIGDVIFFDIRLTHAGQFADPVEYFLMRVGRKLRMDEAAARLKSLYARALRKPCKHSIFFTYGTPSATTDSYCEFEWRARQDRGADNDRYLAQKLVSAVREAGGECHPLMVESSS